MADAIVLLDTAGPLTVSTTFNAPADGPVIFVLSGTAWTQNAGVLIGINLELDGQPIGNMAMCWANQSANHQAMRTTFIPFDNLTFGEHTIEVVNANSETITDVNDYVQVTLLY